MKVEKQQLSDYLSDLHNNLQAVRTILQAGCCSAAKKCSLFIALCRRGGRHGPLEPGRSHYPLESWQCQRVCCSILHDILCHASAWLACCNIA